MNQIKYISYISKQIFYKHQSFRNNMNNVIEPLPEHYHQIAKLQVLLGIQTEGSQSNVEEIQREICALQENKQTGFYLIYVHPQTQLPIASVCIFYENPDVWWIFNAYVLKQFRGKGVFSELFNRIKEIAQEQNVKYLKLDVDVENQKAKKVYEKLGMVYADSRYFEFDFYCQKDDEKQRKQFASGIDLSLKLRFQKGARKQNVGIAVSELNPVLERKPKYLHDNVICMRQDEVVGYCEYYEQFCVWDNVTDFCITALCVKQDNIADSIMRYLSYLSQTVTTNIGVIKFMLTSNEDRGIQNIYPQLCFKVYETMIINL